MGFAFYSDMKIRSLTELGQKYELIDVEIHFLPGLPQIHFLGRADSHLRESALRIRSAFQACGFQFPMTQKIVVNLTPSHIKKISSGAELAIAMGILQLTEQLKGFDLSNLVIFGELGLSGEVLFPPVVKLLPEIANAKWMSGPGFEKLSAGFQISHFKSVKTPHWVEKQSHYQMTVPALISSRVSARQARALEILSTGGHHALIAGAQGSGKTWLTEMLISLLPAPQECILDFHEVMFAKKWSWVPVARPHHSTPPISMVGGGVPPSPGEITRAHGGLLFLDEMFEFKPATLEVLREALSSQKVTVSRGAKSQIFPADFQLVGTTNLCPCGKWTPGKTKTCSFNERRCTSVLQKLSGPLMDRVQGILYFEDRADPKVIPTKRVVETIQKARSFQKSRNRTIPNRVWSEEFLNGQETERWQQFIANFELSSARRSQAVLAWARTLADLEGEIEISKAHLQVAYEDCVLSLSRLLSR